MRGSGSFQRNNLEKDNAGSVMRSWEGRVQKERRFKEREGIRRERRTTYLRKSLLQQAYITGFMPLLIQPSHVTAAETISSCQIHLAQKPDHRFTTKKGNQQTMKTPMTMPRVFAAFFSFANLASLRDKEKFLPRCCLLLILEEGTLVNPLL